MMRCDFQKLPGQMLTGETVMEEEMDEYLRRNGYQLNVEQTSNILKKYFGVEVGDYILVGDGKWIPVHASSFQIDGKKFRMYQLSGIVKDTSGTKGKTVLFIDDRCALGQSYAGGKLDGIFYFFLFRKFIVIKREVVNAWFTQL